MKLLQNSTILMCKCDMFEWRNEPVEKSVMEVNLNYMVNCLSKNVYIIELF